jgi:hypothetical protein
MNTILAIWGTLRFPTSTLETFLDEALMGDGLESGIEYEWPVDGKRPLAEDGGADDDDGEDGSAGEEGDTGEQSYAGEDGYAAHFEGWLAPTELGAALAEAGDIEELFGFFGPDGDSLNVRCMLGDDYRDEWMARIGGLARAAAAAGATGDLEVSDDGGFVGTLSVKDGSSSWVAAAEGDVAKDSGGVADTKRIFDELYERLE